MGSVSIFLCLVPNVTRVYRFWWGPCLSFCVLCPMLPCLSFLVGFVSIFLCLVPNVTRVYVVGGVRVYLSVPCAQCYPCLSFLVGSVSIFLCLVPNVTLSIVFGGVRVYLSVSCAQCYPCLCCWWGPCLSFCALCPMLPVSIVFGGVRVYLSVPCAQCYPVYRFWWGSCLSFCVLCPMLPVSMLLVGSVSIFLCLVPNVTRVYVVGGVRVYLSVSCAQCYPCLCFWWGSCLSFCALCPMLPVSMLLVGFVSIFLCLVPNVTRVYVFGGVRVYLSVPCAQCYPCLCCWWGPCLSFCVLCPMLPVSMFLVGSVSIFLCLVPNVTRVYRFWWGPCLLSVPCAQCYPCLSFLVGSVSIFLCLVPNVTRVYVVGGVRVYLSVSCAQCYPCLCFWWGSCLSFCVLCPMLPVSMLLVGFVSIFLCLVPNVTRVYVVGGVRVYLSVSCAQCYPCLCFWWGSCLSFCVLCPMLPVSMLLVGSVSIFLCLVPNVTRVYLFWWGPCLSFCVLCPMLPVSMLLVGSVSIFLCLVPNVTRVYRF